MIVKNHFINILNRIDMAGVNKVILLGNLGADPEVRYLESGSVVARLRIATSEAYKDKEGNRVETTEWHDVDLWDGLAKVAEQYLRQGDSVYIEGKIRSNTWQDEQGNNRKTIRIRATSMNMVRRANAEGQPRPLAPAGTAASAPAAASNGKAPASSDPLVNSDNEIDDLPF
jgi:single-strand DNA-binding protein